VLLNLSIRDYVLVDRLEMNGASGFTVLTGETGAGKSILLDALGLALGERADAGVVREGCERAEIGALFGLDDAPGLADWLSENGLDGDAGECLMRRVIDRGGRSRAFVNGHPATLAQLKAVGEFLLDIHGQHAHYSLLRPGVQRQILDAYAGTTALAQRVADHYRVWQVAEQAHAEALTRADAGAAELERLQWQVDELEVLAFDADVWRQTLDEHCRLAHAAELLQGAQAVAAGLSGAEPSLCDQLGALRARLAALAEIDASLGAMVELLDGSLVQATEAARELNHYADRLDLDPAALAEHEARIAAVNDAARKYRAKPEELPAQLAEARARLQALGRQADPVALRVEADSAAAAYRKVAERLSAERRRGAAALADAVSAALQRLAMSGGRLEVAINACAPEAGGLETVEFLIAPNATQSLKPLARTASGGELSRIGLALQTVLSSASATPTLIFDEVDAGIGGGVGEIVGRMLAELGRDRQVLCVTHLPQVAACADAHWRVSKSVAEGQSLTRVEPLDATERVEEIARMMGGVKLTATTRKHAAELLAGACRSAD